MIQRIQSVYLLLGSIAIAAPLYLRIWIQHTETGNPVVAVALQVAAAVAALGGLGLIFLHNNREQQYRLTLVVQVLTLLVIVAVVSVLYLSGNMPGASSVSVASSTGAVVLLPFVAYIFFFLARRAIQKDIKLVKSMDRLR